MRAKGIRGWSRAFLLLVCALFILGLGGHFYAEGQNAAEQTTAEQTAAEQTAAEQTAAERTARSETAAVLSEIESATKAAEEEIAQLPSQIDQEHEVVVTALDEWAKEELAKIAAEACAKAESALSATSLPDDDGVFAVWWENRAEAPGNETIEELAIGFVAASSVKLSEVADETMAQVNGSLDEKGRKSLLQAMENVRKPFAQVVQARLPIYETVPLPSAMERAQVILPGDTPQGFTVVGTSGSFLGEGVLKRLGARMVQKTTGKALGKIAPLVSVVLSTSEGADAATAKANLEGQLRRMVLEEYKDGFTAQSLWWGDKDDVAPSTRAAMSGYVRAALESWEGVCRSEVASRRDSACTLTVSESARQYMEDERKQGKNSEALFEEMGRLWTVFGEVVSKLPVEKLKCVLLAAPDQEELRKLSVALGSSLLDHYDMYGGYFLEGIHSLGVANYLSSDTWRSDSIDWRVVSDKIREIPGLSEQKDAVEGLYVLIGEDVPLEGLTADFMAATGAKQDLFQTVWGAVKPDIKKTAHVMVDTNAQGNIELCVKSSAVLAEAFLKSYSAEFWSKSSKNDIGDLMKIAEFRMEKLKRPIESAVIAEQDKGDLLEAYRKTGVNGVELWDIYGTKEAGSQGKDRAKRSVAFLAAGYPFEDLKDGKKLETVAFYDKIPLVGKMIYPYRRFTLIALLGVAILVAVSFLSKKRNSNGGDTPGGAPS